MEASEWYSANTEKGEKEWSCRAPRKAQRTHNTVMYYSPRYEELLCFDSCYQPQEIDEMKLQCSVLHYVHI